MTDVFGCPYVGDRAFEDAFTRTGIPTKRFVQRDSSSSDPVSSIAGIAGFVAPNNPVIPIDCGARCDPLALHSFDKYQENLNNKAAGKCAMLS